MMKPRKKKRQGSLLTRFFSKTDEKSKAAQAKTNKAAKAHVVPVKRAVKSTVPSKATVAEQSTAPSPTAVQRSIAEIKQLIAIGNKDPQRLALLIGNILETEKKRQLAKKEAFNQLLEKIAEGESKEVD